MNQIGTPLPALSPQGGERVAKGRERGGSWLRFTSNLWRCSLSIASGFCLLFHPAATRAADTTLGPFEGHGDVGNVLRAGSVEYDATKQTYLIGGGGENMWSTNDAFHFVWEKMSGDVALAAGIRWIGTGGNAHRKACLLIRQSLNPDSPYADAAVHGDGLTSLQYREAPGAPTREIQSNVSAPRRARVEKKGDFWSMSLGPQGEPAHAPAG